MATPPPLHAVSVLRTVLARAGFDEAALRALLGDPDPRLTGPEQEALWRWRASGSSALAALVRLFVLQQPLSAATARRAFGDQLAEAARLGLIRRRAGAVHPALALTPHAGLLLASDRVARSGREQVPGPTTATILTDRLIVRRPVARALDLGTGLGALALGLTRHVRQVTATDLSPRALAFARFNAALNGRAALALVRSDRFAALRGQRFELIVGNLPFVISPERRFTYRDAGAPADEFLATTVRESGRHLEEGGLAQYLGQWVHTDAPEDERLAPWFVAAGCDALVVRFETEPIEVHAARWSAPGAPSPDERQRRLARWIDHHRRAGIHAISTGLITLRRRSGRRHFFVIDDAPPDGRLTGADLLERLEALSSAARARPRRRVRRRRARPAGATPRRRTGRAPTRDPW